MALTSRKITTYTDNVADLSDRPNEDGLTSEQLKAFFDSRGDNELKDSVNGIVDDLLSTTDGASGADQIGATPVKDGGAETVQGVLEELKDVDNHVNGSVNKVFTTTEKTKLGTIAEGAEVNTVDSVNAKTGTVVLDADDIDDTATTNKFITAGDISKLAGIADNANNYVHPNHSGDVTSVADGATTIANKAVTLAKMADMATASLLGRKTAGIGVPEVLSKSDAQTLLNVEDGANNYVHPTSDGSLHVPATSTTNNGKVLKAGSTAGSISWEADTDTITTINGKTGVIAKEDVVALGIPAQDTVYEHPSTHSADIITDGTTNKTFTAILKSAYDGLVTLFSGITSVVTTLGADNTSIPTSKAVADAISGAGGGDMMKATYDPSNIGANVFSADNHVDGTTNKVFTATEKTKLGTVDENANNYSHPGTHPASMITDLATVATSGSYNDLSSKPSIPSPTTVVDSLASTSTTSALSAKQGKVLNEKIDERTQESCIVTLSTDDTQSVVGQKITLTNVTAATTEEYTLGTGENSHTFKIAQNQIYKIKVNAKVGNYTTPSETSEFTAIASNIRNVAMIYEKIYRYGFKREKTEANPSTRITYLYDAVGMTPAYMNFTSGEFDYGDWEDFVEEVARPVMLKTDGTVDYELSRTDFTKKADGVTASDVASTSYDGNAMIEFRKWKWVYRYEDSTHEYVIFSNDRYSVDYEAYAHENELGSVNNAFYWGAFKGSNVSSKLRSLAGQTIMVNQTRNTEVSYATANGSGHYTIYKSGWDYICDLLTLISKSDNGQASFGQGRHGASNALATGTLKDKPMFMGYDNATSDVKVFGIEGFWGNVWEGMAGLVFNGKIKTKMTPPYNFDGTGYLDTGVIPNGTSGGYVSVASVTGESGYVPKTASGSATQYYCDGLWYNNSQVDYALVGGNWDFGFLDGPRSVALTNLASHTYATFGSRLSFLDPA